MSISKKIIVSVVILACAAVFAAPTVSHGATMEELQAQIAELTAQLAAYQTQLTGLQGGDTTTPTTPTDATYEGVPAGFTFENSLKQGMSDAEVKYLQIVLNGDTDTVLAASGAGSPGNETNYFGSLTKAGVIKFQEKYSADVLAVYGLTNGTGFVGSTTRAKLNVLLAAGTTPTDPTDPTIPTDPTDPTTPTDPVTGEMSATLAVTTPAASSVPQSVSGIVFTKVNLTAGGSDMTVNSVKVTRTGLGADTDVTNVAIYDGATRLTSVRSSFNSAHQMTFNIAGGLVVPANTTKTLDIKAQIGATTYNALGIAAASDIVLATGETVSGSFPIYGNQMTGVSVTVGGVTVDGEGITSQTKKIGTDNVTLASFSLEASSVEDLSFESVILKNKGTAADSDLANLYLKYGDTVVAGPVAMVSDKVTFVLDTPYAIDKSDKITFKVIGDIEDGNLHTVEFILNNDTDLACIGGTYGYNATVTRTEFDATTDGNTTATTISGAQLNINLASTALDTPDEINNVVFGTLDFTASAEDTKITSFVFDMVETDGNSDGVVKVVDELELVDTSDGTAYSLAQSGSLDTNALRENWTCSDEIYLTKGVKRSFEIRGDLPSGIGNSDSYYVLATTTSTYIEAEGVTSGDSITNFSVSSVTGKKVTVKSASLTIVSSAMQAGNAVIDATDVVLFEGVLQAGSASAITIDRMKFEGGAGVFEIDNISQITFYAGGSDLETLTLSDLSEVTDDNGVADFSSLSLTVPAGAANAVVFGVKATLQHSLTTSQTLQIQLDTVSARDSDGDTVTAVNESAATITDGAELTTDRVLTLYGKGILKVSMPITDAGFNKNRYYLAGTVTDYIGKIKVRAENEIIKIKDLNLYNSQTAANDSVNSISLYDENDTLRGAAALLSTGVAAFTDLNYEVPLGTHYLYIKADLRTIGDGASETADSNDYLELKVGTAGIVGITAEGVSSGETLTVGNLNDAVAEGEIAYDTDLDNSYDDSSGDATSTSATKEYRLAGTQITEVGLVSSYSTYSIAGNISGTGLYNVGIVKVVTASSSNTDNDGVALKTILDYLRLKVTKNGTTMALDAMTIQRIGGTVSAKSLTDDATDGIFAAADASGYVTINADATALLGEDAKIGSGETAYFLVKANVTHLQTSLGNDWIKVELDDLSGTTTSTCNITWKDGDTTHPDGGSATTLYDLRLDYDSVDGIKINESSS